MCCGGQVEVFVSDLKIMFGGHGLAVSHPGADDVEGVFFGQFGLPGAAEVLKELGPGLESGPANDLVHRGAEVATTTAVDGDDVAFAGIGLFEGVA